MDKVIDYVDIKRSDMLSIDVLDSANIGMLPDVKAVIEKIPK